VELAGLSPERDAVALGSVAPAIHGATPVDSDAFEKADRHDEGVGDEAPVFEDLGEFVAEEDPEEFHEKQNITSVDGTFEAIVTVALRSGIGAESDDWSLPASLNSAVTALGHAEAPPGELGSADDLAGATPVHWKARRDANRTPAVSQLLSAQDCEFWASEALRAQRVSDELVEAIVASCEGNWVEHDLRANILRVFEVAGLLPAGDPQWEPEFLWDAPCETSVSELAVALYSACNRRERLPGGEQRRLHRRDEEMLIRAMISGRHDVLDAILDDRPTANLIIATAGAVVAGDMFADDFTEADIDVADPDERTERFEATVE
jgi:hypothetical protein